MAYPYGIKNTDPNFVIDPVTRAITQKSGKSRLMQHDHNSECYGFQIPRFIDGHDMSLCNVRIHYINISTNKTDRNSDLYPVTDVAVSGENVVFSWLVSKNATEYSGVLNFTIEFNRSTNNIVDYSWHTDIFKNLTISDTIENDVSEEVESYSDILTQWENALFGIVDTEEASIKSVSQTEQAAIEAKGAATLATIPEDYTATYNMANEAVRVKADGVIQTAEGETVSVIDSSDDYVRGLRIFGKSTQKTTTGAQLCNFPDVENYICEGVVWSCKDGVVTVRGTSTAISSSSKEIKYNLPITAGKYYLLGYTSNVMLLCCITDSNDTLHYYQHVFTLDGTEKNALIYCQIDSGKTVNETVYPMVSVTDGAEFESYSGGFASPSLDWAKDVISTDSVGLQITGRNLFDPNDTANKSDYASIDSDGLITFDIPANSNVQFANWFTNSSDRLIPGKMYTIKCVVRELTNGVMHYLSQHTADLGGSSQFHISRSAPNTGEFTVEAPVLYGNEVTDFMLRSYFGVTDNTKAARCVCRIWVYETDLGAIPYETYVDTQYVNADNMLRGIPVTSGGNYTDEDGQQWICDEIDFERGVLIQRVEFIDNILTNSAGQNIYENSLTDGYVKYTVRRNLLNMVANPDHTAMGFCNRFSVKPISGYITNNTTNKVTCIGWSRTSGGFYMMIPEGVYADLSEFVTYITDNPVSVWYVRATPIETPLTEAELTAYKALHTNYPNTVVLNNAGAHMLVKYNADTKLYIDNKFAELAAMIDKNA